MALFVGPDPRGEGRGEREKTKSGRRRKKVQEGRGSLDYAMVSVWGSCCMRTYGGTSVVVSHCDGDELDWIELGELVRRVGWMSGWVDDGSEELAGAA